MPIRIASLALLAGCLNKGSTGSATLATNGQAPVAVSAWSIESTSRTLIGFQGTIAYLPWEITLGSVPAGTDCASGTGHGSLRHDASSWLASIDIAVPY